MYNSLSFSNRETKTAYSQPFRFLSLSNFLRKNNLDGRKLTIISSVIDDNLSLASRNVPYVSLVKANSCSVKDLFDNELILVDVSGLEDLSNRFGGKN